MRLRDSIVYFLTNNRSKWPFKQLIHLCQKVYQASNNLSFNSEMNGERRVIKVIKDMKIDTVFDAGANRGDHIGLIKEFIPQSLIYAFEPVKDTFDIMRNNTKTYDKINYVNKGLGYKSEVVSFKYFPDASFISTKYNNISGHQFEERKVEVSIQNGDEFCKEHKISRIDFLKIDVEGMDLEVVKGFDDMVTKNKIRIIQFEYGRHWLLSESSLKSAFDYLLPKGYIIGRVLPKEIEFFDYDVSRDNFIDCNYVAVLKGEKDMIKGLSTKSN